MPILFGYHAYRGEAKEWLHQNSDLDALASEKRFILVYPLAPISWSLTQTDNPDIRFFDQLLKELSSKYAIDTNRIYAAGISNGGAFVHLLAAQRSTVIAAVVSHSSSVGQAMASIRSAKRRYPIMIIHGDDDPLIPPARGREAKDFYKQIGHEVEFIESRGTGHAWARDLEATMWQFLEKHPLSGRQP